MLNLILKDFKLTKKTNIIFSIYILFMSSVTIISKAKHPSALYVMSLILVVYLSVSYANRYDIKYNIDFSLNSMPISKFYIVFYKYLSLLIYLIFYFLIIFIATNVLGVIFSFQKNAVSIVDFLMCFNILTLFYAIYYPIYYKINKNSLVMFNFVLFLGVLVMPSIFAKFMNSSYGHSLMHALSNTNINILNLMFFLFALILSIISILISLKIYSKKEFN